MQSFVRIQTAKHKYKQIHGQSTDFTQACQNSLLGAVNIYYKNS